MAKPEFSKYQSYVQVYARVLIEISQSNDVVPYYLITIPQNDFIPFAPIHVPTKEHDNIMNKNNGIQDVEY